MTTVPMIRTSVLPGIKCSSCGDNVELAMMGDHKCSSDALAQRLPADPTDAAETDIQTSKDSSTLHAPPLNHERIPTPPSGYSSKPTSPLQYEIPREPDSDTEHEQDPEQEPEAKTEPEVKQGSYSATKFLRRKPSPIDPAAANGVRVLSDPTSPTTGNKLTGDSMASSQTTSKSLFRFPLRSATLPSQPLTPLTAPMDDEKSAPNMSKSEKTTPFQSTTRVDMINPKLTPDSGPRDPANYPSPMPQPGELFPPQNSHPSSSTTSLQRAQTTSERKTPTSTASGEPGEKKVFGLFRRKSSRQLSKKSISAPEAQSPESVPAMPDLPGPKLLPTGPAPPRPARPGGVDSVLEQLQSSKMTGQTHPQSPEKESPSSPKEEKSNDWHGGNFLQPSWPKRSSDASIYSLAASTPAFRAPASNSSMTQVSETLKPTTALSPLAQAPIVAPPPTPAPAVPSPLAQAPIVTPPPILTPIWQSLQSRPPTAPPTQPPAQASPPVSESPQDQENVEQPSSVLENHNREPALPEGPLKSIKHEDDVIPLTDQPLSIPPRTTSHKALSGKRHHAPTESASSSDGSQHGSEDRTNSSISTPPTSNASSFTQWKQSTDSESAQPSAVATETNQHSVQSSMSSNGRTANFSRPRAPTAASTASSSTSSSTKASDTRLIIPPEPVVEEPAATQTSTVAPTSQIVESPLLMSEPESSPTKPSPDAPPRQHKYRQEYTAPSLPPTPEDQPISRFPQPGLTRRRTTGSKGPCRGCGLDITGRSVKAADGRLTGRYHRECFTCTTCRAPFPAADFYVLHDEPYCRQHYHQLNGSVCGTCKMGIEGQFFEITARRKYHTDCFSCQECRKPLAGDYFEINGRFFCEADAKRYHQKMQLLAPGPRFPERRTTRLMVM